MDTTFGIRQAKYPVLCQYLANIREAVDTAFVIRPSQHPVTGICQYPANIIEAVDTTFGIRPAKYSVISDLLANIREADNVTFAWYPASQISGYL